MWLCITIWTLFIIIVTIFLGVETLFCIIQTLFLKLQFFAIVTISHIWDFISCYCFSVLSLHIPTYGISHLQLYNTIWIIYFYCDFILLIEKLINMIYLLKLSLFFHNCVFIFHNSTFSHICNFKSQFGLTNNLDFISHN